MTGTQTDWWSTGYDEVDSLPEGDVGDRVYLKDQEEFCFLFLDGDEDDKGRWDRRYGAPFCFPAGAKVLTADGVVNIEDVEQGQRVVRADGSLGVVQNTLRRNYTGPMVTVYTKKNTDPLTATANHKVRVLEARQCARPYRSAKYTKWCTPKCDESCSTKLYTEYRVVEKAAGELQEGDFVVIPGPERWAPSNTADVPTIKGPHGKDMELTPSLAWVESFQLRYCASKHHL